MRPVTEEIGQNELVLKVVMTLEVVLLQMHYRFLKKGTFQSVFSVIKF